METPGPGVKWAAPVNGRTGPKTEALSHGGLGADPCKPLAFEQHAARADFALGAPICRPLPCRRALRKSCVFPHFQPREAPWRDAHSKPVWFITGCSTGFGRELSLLLLKRGYRVVATARDKAKIDDIVAGHEKNGLALRLDVDKQDQIEAAVKAAETRFGRIDVLVNNAGYGYLAAVEEGDDADIRAMFETNFFGLAAMTRAVLPTMRAQKSGAIVNISSMGGFIGFPGSGYYAATKFAVEGLSESLSKEVGPLGIKVLIVEPGPFRTDWAGSSLKTHKKLDRSLRRDGASRGGNRSRRSAARSRAIPFARAEAIIAAVEQEKPPLAASARQLRL